MKTPLAGFSDVSAGLPLSAFALGLLQDEQVFATNRAATAALENPKE